MADSHTSLVPNDSYWMEAIDSRNLEPPLQGKHEADVVLVGGGYTSLVAAYFIKKLRPETEVALLEAHYIGFGSSGRNAGIVVQELHHDRVKELGADKVRFTGGKESQKTYFRHSGYPGGVRTRTPRDVRSTRPEFILRNAVKGMLPKGPLGRGMFRKLKIYAGPDHPHEAQQPKKLDLNDIK